MQRQHILGCAIILGTFLVLSLVVLGVMHHPASVQGFGSHLLRMDVAILLLYGLGGVVIWRQRTFNANATAAVVGAQIGLVLGAVQIANHLIEAFVPIRPFVLIISPILLRLALLGTTGAAACRRRTPSEDQVHSMARLYCFGAEDTMSDTLCSCVAAVDLPWMKIG